MILKGGLLVRLFICDACVDYRITVTGLVDKTIIHTFRDSDFFKNFARIAAVVGELDATKFEPHTFHVRPFAPAPSHGLSLVRQALKKPSAVTLEFIDPFAANMKPCAAPEC